MKKEVFTAIIIGFSIGLAITFGLHYLSRPPAETSIMESEVTPSPAESELPDHQITLSGEITSYVTDQPIYTISGSTTPDSFISIISTSQSSLLSASDTGSFTSPITLDPGPNIVQITSFHPDGDQDAAYIDITYIPPREDPEDQHEPSTATPPPTDSEGEQQIDQEVKERIQSVVNKPQSVPPSWYIGLLESRTTNTLSVMTREGVRLASASATTTITNSITNGDPVDLEDISLGDYVISLGELNPEGVLISSKTYILDQDPESELNQKPFYGIIDNIDSTTNQLTITNRSLNQEFVITPSTTSLIQGLIPTNQKIDLAIDQIPAGQPAIIIYTPSPTPTGSDTLDQILIQLSPEQILDLTPTPDAS